MFLRTQIKRMYLKGKTCVFVGKLIIQKVNCFEESKLTSKLNSVNYSIEKNNSKTNCKSKINKLSNNINNNVTNKQKPINSNRVIKYKVRRKTIESGYDNKNDTDIYKIDEDVHNKIKVMNIPNHKTNLDRNTSLYH